MADAASVGSDAGSIGSDAGSIGSDAASVGSDAGSIRHVQASTARGGVFIEWTHKMPIRTLQCIIASTINDDSLEENKKYSRTNWNSIDIVNFFDENYA